MLTSSSSRRTWIEIRLCRSGGRPLRGSSSSRRTWIEIRHTARRQHAGCVVLLAEDVDRNTDGAGVQHAYARRPPRGGRG